MCTSCGLCCDGGLFDSVKLDDEDRERLDANGIEALGRRPHPCPHYGAPLCAIYPVRPWRCGEYRCEVLEALVECRIDFPAARALVDQALAMRAEAAEATEPGLTIVALAQQVRSEAPGSRAAGRLQAMARSAAYRMFVERHFLGPKSRWMTGEDA